MRDILSSYHELGRVSLFFTENVCSITVAMRSFTGSTSTMWEVRKEHIITPLSPSRAIMLSDKRLHSKIQLRSWLLETSVTALPDRFRSLVDSHRVSKSVRAGVAAALDTSPPPPHSSTSRILATLPLPRHIDLPVHVHASFVLHRSRRGIVLFPEEAVEAQYNRWISHRDYPEAVLIGCRCYTPR